MTIIDLVVASFPNKVEHVIDGFTYVKTVNVILKTFEPLAKTGFARGFCR